MNAIYLLRFDDLSPTMNHDVWRRIEMLLLRYGIRPIVGVIPENRDRSLMVSDSDSRFWQRVRSWEKEGWTVAVHGYQHLFLTTDPGIVGLNARSEFAGLPKAIQRARINAALEIFRREGVEPRAWMSPAASLDDSTADILADVHVPVLSDGLWLYPHVDHRGLLWIPQQLWRFRRMPRGVWTISYHFNNWRSSDLTSFEDDLERFAARVTDVEEIMAAFSDRRRSLIDDLWARTHVNVIHARRRIEAVGAIRRR